MIGVTQLQILTGKLRDFSFKNIRSYRGDFKITIVAPATPISEVTTLFIQHGFTSLPVVSESKEFLGIIFQRDLISAEILVYERRNKRIISPFKFHATPAKQISLQASDIMDETPVTVTINTPISILVQDLALNGQDAVAILDDKNIVGVVTQTDLIAELACETLRSE